MLFLTKHVAIEDITGTLSVSGISLKDSIASGKYLSDNNIKRSYSGKTSHGTRLRGTCCKGRHPTGLSDGSDIQRQIIEINSSDSAALVKLPGIGPVLSARIIKYRKSAWRVCAH